MARGFSRKGERFVAKLDEAERSVVVGLLSQTRELLAPPEVPETDDPFEDLVRSWQVPDDAEGLLDEAGRRDPALERLLPPANKQDDEAAAEFRRLTERTLRERKVAHLSTALNALEEAEGGKVSLDRDQAQALAIGLTDVRLVLGERLGLRSDEDAEELHRRLSGVAEEGDAGQVTDEAFVMAAYYDFLTWLQESVTLALMS
ncbi:MAG TPA: DUF2017 domain-containing protein [Segeticoccus sp.]|uniref:DUF2017 domain-containing protein n=1 Tax=Segeticoccus sp. TaxID=2706531 RepID=UPI002D810A3A|nr:DUF2017 domain-containing protein [Segeticoccus sp.]HET8599811.1 DUF2017 domain-containing protein [Segeticoccus sp.]